MLKRGLPEGSEFSGFLQVMSENHDFSRQCLAHIIWVFPNISAPYAPHYTNPYYKVPLEGDPIYGKCL